MSRVIAGKWSSYREQVVPAEAEETQVVETRRAFYAGAAAVYWTLIHKLGDSPDPTPEDIALLDGIAAEIQEFVDELAVRH